MNSIAVKILLSILLMTSICSISAFPENHVVIKRISSNDSMPVSFYEPSIFGDNRIYSGQFISQNNITFSLDSSKVYEIAPYNGTFLPVYVTPCPTVENFETLKESINSNLENNQIQAIKYY